MIGKKLFPEIQELPFGIPTMQQKTYHRSLRQVQVLCITLTTVRSNPLMLKTTLILHNLQRAWATKPMTTIEAHGSMSF